MTPLSLETGTLYAELLDRARARRAAHSVASAPGTFAEKTVKGRRYLYFQYSEPGRGHRQLYLGPASPALESLIERFRSGRADLNRERKTDELLVAQLRAGGAAVPDPASARVIEAFADAGAFTGDAALVGTHAFLAIGTMLGVRWTGTGAATQDIDLAAVRIAIGSPRPEVPDALARLEMGFLPIPQLDSRKPSTSFMIRGARLRVDLLAPQRKREETNPVFVQHLKAFAQPLRYLDYLLSRREDAVLPYGTGVLVSVPDPARFALHKLVVAEERPASEQTKASKDLLQAGELIRVLAERRPADLREAAEAAEFKKKLKKGIAALRSRDPASAGALERISPP